MFRFDCRFLLLFASFALSLGLSQGAPAQDYGEYIPGQSNDDSENYELDPPESSSTWPFGSTLGTIHSSQSFTSPASPFASLIEPGDPIPQPLVTIDCPNAAQDPKPNGLDCRCGEGPDGDPGAPIDLSVQGNVVTYVRDDNGNIVDGSLACGVLTIETLNTTPTGLLVDNDCAYHSSAGTVTGKDKIFPDDRVSSNSRIEVRATCAGLGIFTDGDGDGVEDGDFIPTSAAYDDCGFPCVLELGLEEFGNDKELEAALPAVPGLFDLAQIVSFEQATATSAVRLCPNTAGTDRSTISCLDGKGKGRQSNTGQSVSSEGIYCDTDWKPGVSGTFITIADIHETTPMEIVGDTPKGCSALGILTAAANSETPDVTVLAEGVADEGCHAEGGPDPDLQCRFFQDELFDALDCTSNAGKVVSVEATAHVELLNGAVKALTAAGGVACPE